MQAVVTLSETDYLKARAVWHWLHSRLTREGRFAFLTICVAFGVFGILAGQGWPAFGMLVAGALVMAPFWLLPWRWRRTYRRALVEQYPLTVTFHEDGLTFTGAHGQSWNGAWDSMQGWLEAEGFLYLVHDGKGVVSILPIEGLGSQREAILALVQTKLPSYLAKK